MECLYQYHNKYLHSKICLWMDRSSGFGDNRVKFRYRKHTHGNDRVQFTDCRLAFGIFYVAPSVINIACNFCTRKVDYSCYIIKAVAIFALNCITNKKQIQHNIYCFGTISVTYGWAYLWQIFVSVFHYEFTI